MRSSSSIVLVVQYSVTYAIISTPDESASRDGITNDGMTKCGDANQGIRKGAMANDCIANYGGAGTDGTGTDGADPSGAGGMVRYRVQACSNFFEAIFVVVSVTAHWIRL